MDLSYVKKIQSWVELDNKMLKNKVDMKDVTEEKKVLETEIMEYVEKNNLQSLSISITDGDIKFQKKTTTQVITMKLLKNVLREYLVDHKLQSGNVDEFCDYFSKKLESKVSYTMKRVMASEQTH
jgi:hypothetical protein